MKWDIDKEIKKLEHYSVPGTMITRVLVSKELCEKYNLPEPEKGKESILVWCIAIGLISMPKRFFYGETIKEAHDRALTSLLGKTDGTKE